MTAAEIQTKPAHWAADSWLAAWSPGMHAMQGWCMHVAPSERTQCLAHGQSSRMTEASDVYIQQPSKQHVVREERLDLTDSSPKQMLNVN